MYKILFSDLSALGLPLASFQLLKGLLVGWYRFRNDIDGVAHGFGLDFKHAR